MTALIVGGVLVALALLARAADRWLRRHITDKEF